MCVLVCGNPVKRTPYSFASRFPVRHAMSFAKVPRANSAIQPVMWPQKCCVACLHSQHWEYQTQSLCANREFARS